jgi:hypothetical protein
MFIADILIPDIAYIRSDRLWGPPSLLNNEWLLEFHQEGKSVAA